MTPAVNVLPVSTPNVLVTCAAHCGRWLLRPVLLLLAVGGVATASAQAEPPAAPPGWVSELAPAFALYYAADYEATQRACRDIATESGNPRVQVEAAALGAMATMHLSGRSERLEGRGQLMRLARDNPGLLARPECRLAFGIAATALHETATAILNLQQAAEAFAQQKRLDRLGEALVALAAAWAVHSEWEFTPPGAKIEHPDSPADAERIRTEHLDALRRRAARLPRGVEYVARIDLIRAGYLRKRDRAAALDLLRDIAARPLPPALGARAALRLAACCEEDERWGDAVRLYERVAAADLGEPSRRAEKRCRNILEPRVELEVGPVEIGGRLPVTLAVRNLDRVTLEVRRVDLLSWLQQRRGRYAEALLPVDGALLASRQVDTRAESSHGWWRSSQRLPGLAVPAADGPVVVAAWATDDDGRKRAVKRLFIPGGLRAEMFLGPRHAVLWLTDRAGPVSSGDQAAPRAWFWMHGSFVPRRPEFAGSVAVFALPPEARLMRDKRWVCLVEVGKRVALCRGTLPAAAAGDNAPAVALIGGPPRVALGDSIELFGTLLSTGAAPWSQGRPTQVEVRLIGSDVDQSVTAEVSRAGTFRVTFPVTPAMAGRHLHAVVTLGGQRLLSVFQRPEIVVDDGFGQDVVLRCDIPARVPPASRAVFGTLEAVTPWGTPRAGALGRVAFSAVRLPAAPGEDYRRAVPVSFIFRCDDDGRYRIVQPLSDFRLPEGPLAIRMDAFLFGSGGTEGHVRRETVTGDEVTFLRLVWTPQRPEVGAPVEFDVQWFDPGDLAAGAQPALTVARGDDEPRELPLLPTASGLRTAPWRPPGAGTYEVVATLPRAGRAPRVVRRTLDVVAPTTSESSGATLRVVEARLIAPPGEGADASRVNLKLAGRWDRPLLAIAEDGDPLAAVELPAPGTMAAAELVLPDTGRRPRRVLLVSGFRDRLRVLAAAQVRPPAGRALGIRIVAEAGGKGPGTVLPVGIELSGNAADAGADVLLRLVDRGAMQGIPWAAGRASETSGRLPGGVVAFRSSPVGAERTPNSAPLLESGTLLPDRIRAWFGGATHWLGRAAACAGEAVFEVPLPQRPGRYVLIASAQTPDGRFALAEFPLNLTAGVRLALDVPGRLLVGDRATAALRLENPAPAQTPVTFRLDPGPGLSVEAIRPLDPGVSCQGHAGGTFELVLPAGGTVLLLADVEATRSVAGRATLEVRTATELCRACVHYRVSDETSAPASAPAAIVVRRALWLLREVAARPSPVGKGRPGSDWERIELRRGDRLVPGQRVLVEETILADRTLRDVVWRQWIPGNCREVVGDDAPPALAQVGFQRPARPGTLDFGCDALAAGREIRHEYAFVARRPGVCRLPRPAVTAGGRGVGVRVVPADLRIRIGR